ncbi:MAG: glycosyltransferase family 2 protein, partial [Desulfuromonadaceae bacterium]|nr:glycosyltransferase family 2 protein [Desulfuromonadaceae bacterium]
MTLPQTKLSIVMPNYNGEQLLAKNLPPLISAMNAWGGKWELIIVDDCSSDGSCELLRQNFPEVLLICNDKNLGFSGTCNRGMKAALHPLVLCINTDVLVESGFVTPLMEHFNDKSVFAVTPNILAESEGKNQGIVKGQFGKGFFRGGFAGLHEKYQIRENLYAVGACVIYDLDKFRSLGGYSEIYTPYLFEDVDISYRAWKRGWRSIYDPDSTVYHQSSATISKLGKRRKRRIYFRNRFLFHWVNLSDQSMLFSHAVSVLIRLAVSFIWGDFNYYASFLGALKRLNEVKAIRTAEKKYRILNDDQILTRT